ncbi:MAG: replication protein RepA [Acidobacteriaceae bacterium]|nr:replication protein RepA [Acidobacteriaceae bacterium]
MNAANPNLAQQLSLVGSDEMKRLLGPKERGRVDIAGRVLDDDSDDVSFLHHGFCSVGLPLRRVAQDSQEWARHDGQFALTVHPRSIGLPDGSKLIIGVPYGAKARLLTMWLSTEIKDPRRAAGDKWVEFGRITDWLRAVGIEARGGPRGSIGPTKEQLVRLVFAQFTMVAASAGDLWFDSEALVKGSVFRDSDITLYRDGKASQINWPQGVLLTDNAYDRFSRQSIPMATSRIREISDNAMALDFFFFLAFKLPRIPRAETRLVTWDELRRQFGNCASPSQFRRDHLESLKKALAAYPEANIELSKDGKGYIMRRSDPPVPRNIFIAIPGGATSPIKPAGTLSTQSSLDLRQPLVTPAAVKED